MNNELLLLLIERNVKKPVLGY